MNESEFPIRDQNCVNEARLGRSSERCRLYYLSEAQHPSEQAFVGYLKPYVFADEDRQVRIEKGPEEIVTEAIESGAFARCTARNLWAFLVDASITLEDPILDPFATSFGSDYDLFAILERILRDERYIKAGRF